MKMIPNTDYEVVKEAWNFFCEVREWEPTRSELVWLLLNCFTIPGNFSNWKAEVSAARRLVRRYYLILAGGERLA